MENLVKDCLYFNIATNKEIQSHTGFNERKVFRELKKLKNEVIKIKDGRNIRYALTKNAFGANDNILLWQVDDYGKTSHIANIRPLANGGFFVSGDFLPKVFLGEKGNGLYDDLPYFLRDMAPQGFLGKQIAKKLNEIDGNFPTNPDNWTNEHIGRYLLSNNESLVGNLKFGNNTNLNINKNITKFSRNDYIELANNTINSENFGSSAGGEHPKFSVYCEDTQAHVLVKFSTQNNNEVANRWRDILITEYYANKIINQSGFLTAAESEIIIKGDRLFLESIRFDRHRDFGKSSMISMRLIDAEFIGKGENWVSVAEGLFTKKLIKTQDLHNIKILYLFGQMINNTDMHLGNISFAEHGDTFSLLPIYDMCSMGFAPKGNAEVLPFQNFNINISDKFSNKEIEIAQNLSNSFWQELYQDSRISKEFREFINRLLQNKKLQQSLEFKT